MKKLLLTLSTFAFFLNLTTAQTTVIYDVPADSVIGLSMTSGDICSAPFNIEEMKQTSIGNSWGCMWLSTGSGSVSSVEIQLAFTVNDSVVFDFPTTLNSMANDTVNSGAHVYCAAGQLLTWTLNPTNYNVGSLNTFLVDYSASTMINQIDNLPYLRNPFFRVTVTYFSSVGIEEEIDYSKKELVRITDLLGREVQYEPNKALIYYYSDGTVRKMMQIQ